MQHLSVQHASKPNPVQIHYTNPRHSLGLQVSLKGQVYKNCLLHQGSRYYSITIPKSFLFPALHPQTCIPSFLCFILIRSRRKFFWSQSLPKLCYKYTRRADQNTEATERLGWCIRRKKEAFAKKMQILQQEVYNFFLILHVLPHPVRKIAKTHLIPLAQTALFNLVSMRTSGVPISFIANLRISLRARGARFLKPLGQTQEPLL